MDKGKKMFWVFAICLLLFAVTGTVNAIPAPGSCEIIENPANEHVRCKSSELKFYNNPEKIEIVESPMLPNTSEFKRLQDEFNQRTSEQWEGYSVSLGIPGKYVFRINDSYEITVLLKSSIYSAPTLQAISILSALALIIAGGILWKFSKYKQPAQILIALGILFILLFFMTYIINF